MMNPTPSAATPVAEETKQIEEKKEKKPMQLSFVKKMSATRNKLEEESSPTVINLNILLILKFNLQVQPKAAIKSSIMSTSSNNALDQSANFGDVSHISHNSTFSTTMATIPNNFNDSRISEFPEIEEEEPMTNLNQSGMKQSKSMKSIKKLTLIQTFIILENLILK